MNKVAGLFQTILAKSIFVVVAMLLLSSGCASRARSRLQVSSASVSASKNSGGITGVEICTAVGRVARHQLESLSDGEYPAVTNLAQAGDAKPPEGIGWNYPQGVMLYDMERCVQVTGDKEVDQFVVRYNLICARYYH